MDRALRNPLHVAGKPTNGDSGYQELSNVMLAVEVQKFNGYNHFSSSAANLLEEVVRRLAVTANPSEVIQAMGMLPGVPGIGQQYGVGSPHQAPSGNSGNVRDLPASERPVSPGSTVRVMDLEAPRAVVRLDITKIQRKDRFNVMFEHLIKQVDGDTAHGMVSEFKQMYNLSSIISQGGLDSLKLAIYWLQPSRPGAMKGANSTTSDVYWRWE